MFAPEIESDQDLSLTHQASKIGAKVFETLDLGQNIFS